MTEGKASRRRYRSPRREQQAAATRREIVLAAKRLFEVRGYASTSMNAVATEAGVALKTVYLVFESKARLLRAVWDLSLKGDDSDAPVAERPWYVEVLEEPDPERKLRRLAAASCVVKVRIATLLGVIRDAAPSDDEISALWTLIQSDFHANQGAIVATLDRAGALAPGLDGTHATDILWTLNHPDVWLLLVGQRGWTAAQFERWLGDTAIAQLLGAPNSGRRGGR
ncbi:MAG: TetR family transcriptional regulator [Actinobacteria bacterium]|nr:TetR family transcriptional regulator [Actinomycetota bacterium]MBW3649644.1 TetR family transcriptional regulator [Actinomycetota bacterium]